MKETGGEEEQRNLKMMKNARTITEISRSRESG
jgi:hypothetical protein